MQNSRNARNTFNKLSLLKMIINFFCQLEDRKLFTFFFKVQKTSMNSGSLSTNGILETNFAKLRILKYFKLQLVLIFKWKITSI